MNVYRFKIDRKKVAYGTGEAIAAANTPQDAWDVTKKNIGWEAEFFDSVHPEQLHELTCSLSEPALICYNCYVD